MTELFCLLLCLVCIGLACWSDVNAQNHIDKGLDDAWNLSEQGDKHD
jgi:hypothetical protein